MIHPVNLCPICGSLAAGAMQPCESCRKEMLYYCLAEDAIESCIFCSMDLAGADNPCCHCRDISERVINRTIAIGPWMGALREWLSQLKYAGDARLAEWLSACLFEIWSLHWPGIPIVPIPPRRGKIKREGRDAVRLLALHLEWRGTPIMELLRRTDKLPQKTLNRQERLENSNMKFVYVGKRNPPNECVLLDDVSTTGATLSRCAEILRDYGVKKVSALVVCRD